jgi:GH35 family endo-1,4-beta-xylanase
MIFGMVRQAMAAMAVIVAVMVIVVVMGGATAVAVEIPAGGKPGLVVGAEQVATYNSVGTVKRVKVEGAGAAGGAAATGGGEAVWRFEVTNPSKQDWDAQWIAKAAAVKQGDRCLMIVRARSGSEERAVGQARLQGMVDGKFRWAGGSNFEVGPEWKTFYFPFIAERDIPEGAASLTMVFGNRRQVVEVGMAELLNYGPGFALSKLPREWVHYEGREPEAAWRKEALERIERIRKGDFRLTVVDGQGKPIGGAQVDVRLKRHSFGFGSAVAASWLTGKSAEAARYRELVDELFSRVVMENDMKPHALGWVKREGKSKSVLGDRTEAALDWLVERDIEVRGHYLVWGAFEDWSRKLRSEPAAIRQRYMEHIDEVTGAADDRVVEWDGVNHPVAWDRELRIDLVAGKSFYPELWRHMRSRTSRPLWVNEDQVFRPGRQQEEYFEWIKELQAAGLVIDGIGNQAHFDKTFLPGPVEMMRVSDRFAALVPRLQLTEFDVVTDGDEQLQADYLRDCLIMAFGHEAYTGFVMWGFWERAHWKPDAALFREDFEAKPAGRVWQEWVGEKWRTRWSGKSEGDGSVSFRGFKGRYVVTVRLDGRVSRHEVVLDDAGREGRVVVGR